MCRIYGYMGLAMVPERTLQSVSKAQIHGGPDQQNFVQKENWALGNDRLMIQGRSGGTQPFHAQDVYAVYNGEIYNHDELRSDLKDKGYKFTDHCDGNVIVPLYLEYGEAAFVQMEGMFAIAIVDLRDQPKLIIANDPIAIKSIYYHFDEKHKTLFFASEIDALLQFEFENPKITFEGVDAYFTMRAICDEQTILQGIKTLSPGSILKYDLAGNQPILDHYRTTTKFVFNEKGNLTDLLEAELKQEIELLSKAEVPICFINSGGLDSSLLTAMAAKTITGGITSFHVCYKGNWPFDERHYARRVAKFVGADHHEVELNPNDFPDLIQEMIPHLGQPNAAPHCLSSFGMFKQIKQEGFTVAIAGEGADEVFVGYERFLRAFDTDANWIDRYLGKFGAFDQSYKKLVYSEALSDHLSQKGDCEIRLKEILSKIPPGEGRLNTLMQLDQNDRFPYYILRRTDHLSMAHAVEVRVPFCQPRIVQFGNDLPMEAKTNGHYVKKILSDIGRKYLPIEIIERKKQPFTLPIMAIMLNNNRLSDFMNDVFNSEIALTNEFLSPERIKTLFKDFKNNPREDMAQLVWSSLILILWMEWFKTAAAKRVSL